MKRTLLTLCIALPIGHLIDSVDKIAHGTEKYEGYFIINTIIAICIFFASRLIVDKLITNKK